MEARYLRDQLQRVLDQNVFLDSQNLSTLTTLITDGLRSSDLVVLLATKSVLKRPYCLLELWCAARWDIPIVVLEIAQRSADWEEAWRLLNDLEAGLGDPKLVAQVEAVLKGAVAQMGDEGEVPPTVNEAGLQISAALQVDVRAARFAKSAPKEIAPGATFHPWGTDSGVFADISDLIDEMSRAVGRAPPQMARKFLLDKEQRRRLFSDPKQLKRLSSTWQAARSRASLISATPAASSECSSTEDVQVLPRGDTFKHLMSATGVSYSADETPGSPPKSLATSRKLKTGPKDDDTVLCICCSRVDSVAVDAAKFLRNALEIKLGGKVCFDPQPLCHDACGGSTEAPWGTSQDEWKRFKGETCRLISKRLVEGIGKAQGVLLLQTQAVYTNPVTLLELCMPCCSSNPGRAA